MNTRDGKHIFITIFFLIYIYKARREGEVSWWLHDYATLCLFLLSPRGAKARRATSTRREKGCAECSNRWDESSVLVRYAFSFSSRVPFSSFSLILYYSLSLVSFISICLTYLSNFPLSSSASFDLVSPFSSGSSLCACLLLPNPLLFSFMPCC